MSMLLRKITRAKWQPLPGNNDVNADAITLCCRTSSNTLSVWKVDSDSASDVELGVLAMVAAQERLDKMDFVLIPENELQGKVTILNTPGITPVKVLVSNHRDLAHLTYSSLGFVKDCIINSIKNSMAKRYTVSDLKKILLKAIQQGVIRREDLNERLRSELPSA